jgi:chromosomal replication initiation ATPase DnaA
MPDQLSFGFPAPGLGFDDLVISPVNESALGIVQRPENWPTPVLCLVGPPKAGLSVIANAWARKFGGDVFEARAFAAARARDVDVRAATYTAIDGADRVPAGDSLLSLINLVSAGAGRLLLTANRPPPQWQARSADLKSRLNSMPVAEIYAPDEAMMLGRLKAAAVRHFLKLEPDVLKYLVPRLDLSYEAVETFAERLSDGVTDMGRAPSVPLVKDVLDAMEADAEGRASPD